MKLADLLRTLNGHGLLQAGGPSTGLDAAATVPVTGLAYDSRAVVPGDVFVGLRGERADGSAFAPQAVDRGAVAVVTESPAPADPRVPSLQVSDGRLALAVLSAWFYRHPSRELRLTGITGTNGKTTTSYLVRAIHEAAGFPCGLIGTVQYSVGADLRDAPRTTPESLDVQRMLREMVTAGARACAMEVSSHALALRRVDSTHFAAAVFTNLTQDHLDYHGDMEAYFAAKRRLFDMLPAGAPAVINLDDPRGATLAAGRPASVTYGVSAHADVRPDHVMPSLSGLAFDAMTPAGRLRVQSRLGGQFNLYNLLSAVATGVALNLPNAAIEGGLADMTAVPGRFQVVSDPADDITVIVDYAHTDDALKNVLDAVRPLASRAVITVFGCGGDRDRKKRPLMGAVAARLSDRVVITSDNPRSEDPERIIDDIEAGLTPPAAGAAAARWMREADRRAAIDRAIADAGTDDVVLIAGKGHEKYQVTGDRVLPFDDVVVARTALAQRRSRREGAA